MRRNEIALLVLVVNALLSSVGCISIGTHINTSQVSKTYRLVPLRDSKNPEIVYSTIAIIEETYLESLNSEMKEKYARRRRLKRHIGFFGYLKSTEQEFGVKLVFPW